MITHRSWHLIVWCIINAKTENVDMAVHISNVSLTITMTKKIQKKPNATSDTYVL